MHMFVAVWQYPAVVYNILTFLKVIKYIWNSTQLVTYLKPGSRIQLLPRQPLQHMRL